MQPCRDSTTANQSRRDLHPGSPLPVSPTGSPADALGRRREVRAVFPRRHRDPSAETCRVITCTLPSEPSVTVRLADLAALAGVPLCVRRASDNHGQRPTTPGRHYRFGRSGRFGRSNPPHERVGGSKAGMFRVQGRSCETPQTTQPAHRPRSEALRLCPIARTDQSTPSSGSTPRSLSTAG